MQTQAGGGRFTLDIALDASQVEDRKADQAVQVVVQDSKGALQAARVGVNAKGEAAASFSFVEHPGNVRVMVGPFDATPEEMTGLQTVAIDVPARQWANQPTLRLPPIVISPYYWAWWLIWCRDFIIHGRVVCPDGQPVPGATVCAYDVDWFFFWSTSQQIACTTTDVTGAFTLKFRWCCGWWPWWWWRSRYWELDPKLIERIQPVLARNPDIARLIKPTPQPSLTDLHEILGAEGSVQIQAGGLDPAKLTALREPLLSRLPPAPELEQLRIWPWYPWYPWRDCTPDVIFKVTQNCTPIGGPTLIVNETIWDTRWDIPTNLTVTLIANDKACCLPRSHPCFGGQECLDFTMACSDTIDHIGGNTGALATPLGYHNPQVVSSYSDQPYGGTIPIFGTVDCMDTVDYYELEWATSSAGPWNTMPPAANGAFNRLYLDLAAITFHAATFAANAIGGRNVYETLQHYQSTHPPNDWGSNRLWMGSTRDQLIGWQTATTFPDGAYYLRARGWTLSGNTLINPRTLHICGSNADAHIVLRVDNRLVGAGPNDAHNNPCTAVHLCTQEPDTAIIAVTIKKADGTLIVIPACGIEHVTAGDHVIVDFVAYDPDGHLLYYDLWAHYGINQAIPLLNFGGPSAGPAWSGNGSPVPAALQAGPNYAHALGQGATRPVWRGGAMRLEVPALSAFPVPCCYELRLTAYKRTLVDCNTVFANVSEVSFTIS